MSRRGSLVTKKFASVLGVVHASRFRSTYGRLPKNSPIMPTAKLRNGYWNIYPGLQLFSTNSNTITGANRVKNVKVQPPAPASSSFKFPNWLKWVLSSALSLLLPFWTHDSKRLQRIEGGAEFVAEEVEKVAEVVEKVAMVAEKVSEEVAEKLPGDGKLKKAALVVECVSKHAAHDAHVTKEFIHKVEEFKNDLNGLESIIEPIIHNVVVKKESDRK